MGWESLRQIAQNNRDLQEENAQTPPVACPIDGAVLEIRDDGVRHCEMGNYVWPPGSRIRRS